MNLLLPRNHSRAHDSSYLARQLEARYRKAAAVDLAHIPFPERMLLNLGLNQLGNFPSQLIGL